MARLEGPSNDSFVASTIYSVFGDRLADASDFQLFAGTAVFSTAVVLGGWAAATGLAGGGSLLGAGGTVLSYTSLGFSGARVAITGEGYTDLALDAAGVGVLRYAGTATGLAKTFWLSTDVGLNAYQGYTGTVGAYDAFSQGNYVGGTLSAVSGLLGIASAGYGARNLGHVLRTDPTTNPLNYRLTVSNQLSTLNSGVPLPGVRYVDPNGIPQGFTEAQFAKFSRAARQLQKRAGLPTGELLVQGSRARGAARNISDIDIALRVDERTFFDLAEQALSRARPGTRLRETILSRVRRGQLSSFDLGPEFQQLRRSMLDPRSPVPVQFSVIKQGGSFDTGPFIALN